MKNVLAKAQGTLLQAPKSQKGREPENENQYLRFSIFGFSAFTGHRESHSNVPCALRLFFHF